MLHGYVCLCAPCKASETCIRAHEPDHQRHRRCSREDGSNSFKCARGSARPAEGRWSLCATFLGEAGSGGLEGGLCQLAQGSPDSAATVACCPGPLGLECVFMARRSAHKGTGQTAQISALDSTGSCWGVGWERCRAIVLWRGRCVPQCPVPQRAESRPGTGRSTPSPGGPGCELLGPAVGAPLPGEAALCKLPGWNASLLLSPPPPLCVSPRI